MQPGPPQQEPNPFKPGSENETLLRKTIRSNWIMLSIPFAVLLVSIILMVVEPGIIIFGFMGALFSAFFVYIKINSNQEKYIQKFRETIVQNIIKAKDASINYEPKSYFVAKEILSSGLLERMPNIYEGENYFEQKTPNYTLEIAWAYAVKQRLGQLRTSPNGTLRQSSSSETMLHGLVYKFTLPKRFKTNVIIREDQGKGLFGSEEDNPDALYGQFRNITVGNFAFEKEFEVYTLDETEGKKMIDEDVVQFLMYVRKYYKGRVQISFMGNYIFATIDTHKKYFKPGFILSKGNASVKQVSDDAKSIFYFAELMAPILKKFN